MCRRLQNRRVFGHTLHPITRGKPMAIVGAINSSPRRRAPDFPFSLTATAAIESSPVSAPFSGGFYATIAVFCSTHIRRSCLSAALIEPVRWLKTGAPENFLTNEPSDSGSWVWSGNWGQPAGASTFCQVTYPTHPICFQHNVTGNVCCDTWARQHCHQLADPSLRKFLYGHWVRLIRTSSVRAGLLLPICVTFQKIPTPRERWDLTSSLAWLTRNLPGRLSNLPEEEKVSNTVRPSRVMRPLRAGYPLSWTSFILCEQYPVALMSHQIIGAVDALATDSSSLCCSR